ncbi:hypothetical protein Tsubulata_005521 [Turnera subulata]|uniref:Membrane-associated kinase regulator 4 n=1 Tax=Turnera subulata TaxID=218843 RepID=A0A9Q0FIB6_9ROSI|nr:hypothetical protein Tsubulata_005521 [Turnera subulata]
MAKDQSSCSHHADADDDYIDMEVSSSPNLFCYSITSPPQSKEFEFQMSSISHNRETTTSPADELFYKGKLLPLHLPPRLQMVEKLLQNPTTTTTFFNRKEDPFEETYVIPSIPSSTSPSTNLNTPLESCNISPSESCRVSSELNPDEYFLEWSSETNSFIGDHPKKSWTKKLKQSSLGQKLKASRAYLKSLFTKSDCTNDSFAKPAGNAEKASNSKGNDSLSQYTKVATKTPFVKTDNDRYKLPNTLKRSIEKEMLEDNFRSQRRSFSGAIQWHSAIKSSLSSSTSTSTSTSSSGSSSSSSSFSFSSNAFCDLQLLKRSSSANSELESSIEGAIAHCKRSQLLYSPRKTASEVGACSLSASGIAACGGDLGRPKLCSV